jgi:hypothetical protein
MAHRLGVASLCVALVLGAGCSLFLKGASENPSPDVEPDCQPFIIVPIIDAALGLGIAAWAIGQPCQDAAVGCAFALAGSAAIVAAGVYGYFKVKKCERAREAYKANAPGGAELGAAEPPR